MYGLFAKKERGLRTEEKNLSTLQICLLFRKTDGLKDTSSLLEICNTYVQKNL